MNDWIVALAGVGLVIGVFNLWLLVDLRRRVAGASAPPPDEAYHPAKERVIAQFERDYLLRLVARAGGNMSKAARLASVDRTTLYRLMDKHNVLRGADSETGE